MKMASLSPDGIGNDFCETPICAPMLMIDGAWILWLQVFLGYSMANLFLSMPDVFRQFMATVEPCPRLAIMMVRKPIEKIRRRARRIISMLKLTPVRSFYP